MRFIIDRGTWRCGGREGTTARGRGEVQLLNAEGYMCCLGQISLQLGATREGICKVASPEDIATELRCDLSLLRRMSSHIPGFEPTELADTAMIVNDNGEFDDSQRETHLVELFQGYGHEVMFVGRYDQPIPADPHLQGTA